MYRGIKVLRLVTFDAISLYRIVEIIRMSSMDEDQDGGSESAVLETKESLVGRLTNSALFDGKLFQ